MIDTIRVALAQINSVVGDLTGNAQKISESTINAKSNGADLIVFPELALTGYPPEDLLVRRAFIRRCAETLENLAEGIEGITAIVGAPVMRNNNLLNSAVVLGGANVKSVISKTELPNYGVFDERRYFTTGVNGPLIKIGAALIGVSICEDIWVENRLLDEQARGGANLLVNISSSPYRLGAGATRIKIVTDHCKRLSIPMAYCNIVGGQDELVFDGASFICGPDGEITDTARSFIEDLLMADIAVNSGDANGRDVIELAAGTEGKTAIPDVERIKITDENEEVYSALTLGTRDYVNKNGFREVVIALSGGIDSALTTAVAVDALGPERVHVVFMPSPYSSQQSLDDALQISENLGLNMMNLPIGDLMEGFDNTLADAFAGYEKNVTEENIQARIRGALVMALSNKFGWLTLTTGNKSEIAVGYCTLYGDTVGGFAVIKDVFKTKVFHLCEWRNEKAGYDLIPQTIIDKPPSAELKPDQKDSDSLPPYDVLDHILFEYIEQEKSVEEIEQGGYDHQLVLRVVSMVDGNEYKRRQGPIGVKITPKAFGRDRRFPITCKYRD